MYPHDEWYAVELGNEIGIQCRADICDITENAFVTVNASGEFAVRSGDPARDWWYKKLASESLTS